MSTPKVGTIKCPKCERILTPQGMPGHLVYAHGVAPLEAKRRTKGSRPSTESKPARSTSQRRQARKAPSAAPTTGSGTPTPSTPPKARSWIDEL